MIGSAAVNLSTRYYDVKVQIGDETGNWIKDVLLDNITVFWGVMECGSIVTSNILVAASTLSFAHDPNNSSPT